ncbi:MAG: TIGR03960 family B12-binding radical SAM protein [Phycisphaerae bacterium]|nr:TIGR03960 family B12-binding radical SAM protein [Phycisphaerae bacterium]
MSWFIKPSVAAMIAKMMRYVGNIVSEKLLPRLRQPGQFVGLETNARRKDPQAAEVSFVLGFPDAYTIGISHLGSQVLYHRLNDMPAVACDRTYCPQPEAEQVFRELGIPLFGWESRIAIGDFDVIGFSLAYELCITNVLTMLDLAGVPLLAADRTDGDPIILGGDALADSPEPLADFFDIIQPGDGEEPLAALAELLRQAKRDNLSRDEKLLKIAREVPSVYVPKFYQPAQADQPTSVTPTRDDIPAVIQRACIADMAASPAGDKPLVPLSEGVHERVIIEIMRGCPNLCRFCQAGHVRLPVRRRSVDEIIAAARAGIDSTGYREISLLSLSTSDYPNLEELIERLNAEFAGRRVSISLPSLRVDSQLTVLPKLTAAVRKGGLTIAAEAGSDRMRQAIRKNITEEDMLNGVRAAWQAGYKSVKVYFIAGLPGETMDDIDQIFYLSKRLADTRRDVDGHRGAINSSVSWLVPKPHTPMQWQAMAGEDYFWQVRHRLIELSRRSTVNFKFHRIEQSILEALLCRGGREISKTILAAWELGARMDSWSEHWNWEIWQQAIQQTGVDIDAVVHSELPMDKPLPWSHINCHLPDDFLREQRKQMLE